MFRLKLFGGLSLEADERAAPGRTAQRRRLALLALLAGEHGRAVSRDKLLAYFWPESDTAHARHALGQVLYGLRQDLGEDALLAGPDDLRINTAVITSDLSDFEAALERGELERAVALYAGPFLDGFFIRDAPEFERWVETKRDQLCRRCALALEALARAAADRGDHRVAVQWWRQRAALDPLDAQVAVALMRALEASGDRAGALQHAKIHAALLKAELDAAPNPGVEALAASLRERGEPSKSPGVLAPRAPASSPSLASLASRPRARLRLAISVGCVLAIGAAVFVWYARHASASSSRLVLLGTLHSPDSSLALAVREALRAELEAAPDIRLLSDQQIRETTRLMELPTGAAVGRATALEIAERTGAPLAVVGSASRLGTGVLIVAQLFDARTGNPIATLTARPTRSDAVIGEVTRLARSLRERVTGASVDSSPAPLPAVTTTSLPALQEYALARQALGRSDRYGALALAEAAVVQDSEFALAQSLVGDLLWFFNQQRDAEYHLRRAFQLSQRLPPRERLIARARYEELVLDRLDSALAYWQRLRSAYPDEIQAYEGMEWTYRYMGFPSRAAAVADTALHLDPTAITPNASNRLFGLIDADDTTAALRFAQASAATLTWGQAYVHYRSALLRTDWGAALAAVDTSIALAGTWAALLRHSTHLALGRTSDAARDLDAMLRERPQWMAAQRARVDQALVELARGGSRARAAVVARDVLNWLRSADISPQHIALMAMSIAELAGRTHDTTTIADTRRFIIQRDTGRGLRSYRMALLVLDAARAFALGDMYNAAALVERARGVWYANPGFASFLLLEADARAALGERERALHLYGTYLALEGQLQGDREPWAPFQPIAAAAYLRLQRDNRF